MEFLKAKIPKDLDAICDAKINFDRIPASRSHLPVTVPIRTQGREMLLAGAEYRATETGHGVNKIRWLEQEDGQSLDVWLNYVVKWDEVGVAPWLSEKDRSREYALDLL